MPGFVDTHTHLAMTYKEVPENNIYYYTYVADSTAAARDPGGVERDAGAQPPASP